MITIYHLAVSQSDRIVWLMEELELPYQLEWFDRGPDGLATADYLALHPAGTAPVVKDGERLLTESAVILESICHRHAGGRLTIGPDQAAYEDYLYWLHFNNNIQGLFFASLALGEPVDGSENRAAGFIARRADRYLRYLDQRLSESEYLAGSEFTCADIMVTFNLTTLPPFGGLRVAELPHAQAYVERIAKRPAYQKAMSIAGPGATRPGA
ncbi:MAG: glutathione S-transferase [bacterium]|nr:glutathione S-transferase [bacterium]